MKKYLSVFSLSFLCALKNYKSLIGLSIFLMTCLLIFANLWKVVAAKTGVVTLNGTQLLWYIAFNEWILVSLPDVQDHIEDDFRSGRLAYQLPRPISYLGSVFAESLGTLSVNLIVLGAVTFLFTWFQAGTLPFPPIGLMISIVFGCIASVLAIIFLMIIGLSSFWIHDVTPFYWIWEKLLFMFGGLILPLTVYPEWMQFLAKFTPFPSILGERSALALHLDLAHIFHLTLSIIGWAGIGLICLFFFYRKSLSTLNIEGG